MYLNTKCIDAFKYFSKCRPIWSINILKMNYLLDIIFSSIIQDVNKMEY